LPGVNGATAAAALSPQAVSTTSGLAGALGGNLLFGGSSAAQARLIVNEVTSTSISALNGLVEVYGQSADVVIANPNGITCNGCGFINTQRASLVAGKPTWAGSNMAGFSVAGGAIAVEGLGLKGDGLASLDLVAGSLQVNGKIDLPAGNSAIYAVLGPNTVDYATLAPTPQSRVGVQPGYALDMSAVGSMYANQIYLLANERGVGVNGSGWVEARSGGLTLDTAGNLSLRGVMKTPVAGSAVVLSAANIFVRDGTVNSAGLALVQASESIEWTQGIALGSDVMVASAGNMLLAAPRVISTGDVRFSSNGDLTLQAGDIKAAGSVSLNAARDLTMQPTQTSGTVIDGSTTREFTRYTRSQIDAVGSVAVQSTKGLVTLDGAQIGKTSPKKPRFQGQPPTCPAPRAWCRRGCGQAAT
jgi:filamentous hemagglutinin